MASLLLSHVEKKFGSQTIIEGMNLDIHSGEFMVLVGPSGCGKSTLLRMIAGLESVTSGALSIDGKDVRRLSPKERGIAMVFQSYALYPHMTVAQNIGFALKLSGLPAQQIKTQIAEVAAILRIDDLLHKKPGQLSGGQKQRVAMGRAMVRSPKIFLFDEPLSNLDAQLRVTMRAEIAELHKKLGVTMIYVTHDQVEAMTLADRIVVLNKGKIEQIGAPLEVFHDPKSVFVARFIGTPPMNILETAQHSNLIKNAKGAFLGIRPEQINLQSTPGSISLGLAHLRLVEPLGSVVLQHYRLGDTNSMVVVETRSSTSGAESSELFVQPDRLYWFDQDGQRLKVQS
jgi:ABC-type sugar transport system ATPase subunit